MFEGNPPLPSHACPFDDDEWGGKALRPLSWDELVARLSAARDLRMACDLADEGSEASFDAGSARWIAAHHGGQQAINPDSSSNGKGPAGTASGRMLDAGFGAAGN